MSNVKDIIDNWDPIGLFPYCPGNEYHAEISQIEAFLCKNPEKHELGEFIYTVFVNAFGKKAFQRSIAECCTIANKITENGT